MRYCVTVKKPQTRLDGGNERLVLNNIFLYVSIKKKILDFFFHLQRPCSYLQHLTKAFLSCYTIATQFVRFFSFVKFNLCLNKAW